jgi:eukaryotic-like serine/threonine-protein kinase
MALMPDAGLPRLVRFGPFELDLAVGDLQRDGRRVRLPEQQFQILQMLLLSEGGVVSRKEIRKRLWPNDTIVEFDRSINAAIMKLRSALGDTADQPNFIETVARRGYRFLVPAQFAGNKLPVAPTALVRLGSLVGQRVSHYRVLGVLGGGGMGLVYKAEDLKLNRPVALKFIPEELAVDPQTLRRFEREARTASMLNHPNICTIYQVEEHGTEPFIVMELLEGETLRELISKSATSADGERQPLPLEQVLDIACQIAKGLDAAHQKGIIHRDIKPANIFVLPTGQVKILDFGLAKIAQTATQVQTDPPDEESPHNRQTGSPHRLSIEHSLSGTGSAMGTAGYMSPEQVCGKKLDARSDLFSFGLVLFEMATGQRAFSGDTAVIVQDAILNQTLPDVGDLNPELPTALEKIIRKALEKDRELRYATAVEMLADLRDLKAAVDAHSVRNRPIFYRALGWCVGGLVIVSLATVAYYFATWHELIPFEHFSIQKAADNEHVKLTAISPDGMYIASVVTGASDVESLWVRHIPTSTERLILQDATFKYYDLIFSPEGSYLYLMIKSVDGNAIDSADEYRVPVFGGRPTRILEHLDFFPSFIDGVQRLCFYRENHAAHTYSFLSASADGGAEQVLAIGKAPYPIEAACAPNGRLAAVEDNLGKIETLDFASGSKKTLTSMATTSGWLTGLRWDPTGKGLFASRTQISRPYGAQLSFLSYPGGRFHQITNDLSEYAGISLTADGKTIATTKKDRNLGFAVLSLANPTRLEEHGPRGLGWFTWLDAGKILATDETSALKVLDILKDETSTLQIGKGQWFDDPALCGPDMLVSSGGSLDEGTRVYKIRLDGSGATKLTEGPDDLFPQCTPDGRSLFYADNRDLMNPLIMRMSLEGGAAQRVAVGVYYSLSSNGKLLAIPNIEGVPQLQVFSAETLQKIQSFQLKQNVSRITFSADNKSIFYPTKTGAATTIWRQPLDALSSVKVASLPGTSVDWIRSSSDGSKLGLTIATPRAEAVLLREVR